MGRDARWEFNRKKLFDHTDYMAMVCGDLHDMAEVCGMTYCHEVLIIRGDFIIIIYYFGINIIRLLNVALFLIVLFTRLGVPDDDVVDDVQINIIILLLLLHYVLSYLTTFWDISIYDLIILYIFNIFILKYEIIIFTRVS